MAKVNTHRGEVPITIEGKQFVMVPTMQTVSRVEDTVGSLSKFANGFSEGNFKIADIASVISIATEADGGPTYRDMYEVCLGKGVTTFLQPVAEFIANCLGGLENVKKGGGEKETANPTG